MYKLFQALRNFILPAVVFFQLSAFAQTGPTAMMPSATDIPGWRLDGDYSVTSLEKLTSSDQVKGPVFRELGFDYSVSGLYYSLKRGQIRVNVDVAASSFGACAIFSRYASGYKWEKDIGNDSYSSEIRFGFWKHLYCVTMEADTAGDITEEGFRLIGTWIASRIRMKGAIPSITSEFGGGNGQVTLFKGKLGLSEIYYFSPLNIFNFSEGIAVKDGDITDIWLRYVDNSEAVRKFTEAAGILGSMKKFSDFIMLSDFAWAMKDSGGRTLTFRAEDEYIKIRIK